MWHQLEISFFFFYIYWQLYQEERNRLNSIYPNKSKYPPEFHKPSNNQNIQTLLVVPFYLTPHSSRSYGHSTGIKFWMPRRFPIVFILHIFILRMTMYTLLRGCPLASQSCATLKINILQVNSSNTNPLSWVHSHAFINY